MIPIGDSTRRRRTPWVNYALILANAAAFVWLLTLSTDLIEGSRAQQIGASRDLAEGSCYGLLMAPTEVNEVYCEWGFQPKEFFDVLRDEPEVADPNRAQILLSILVSTFIHAGWLHFLGNMLFLWVFGDNVEDRMGHAAYLVFYLVAGIVAALIQAVADVDSIIPTVGASGAVAGVLGAYLLLFPRATIYVVIPFFILIFIPLPIPAVVMIGIWFLQNLLSGVATLGDAATADESVAWFAHIGGFLFGTLIALFYRGKRPRATYR